MFENILGYAHRLEEKPAKIDYFATSLPAMLLFDDDLAMRNRIEVDFLRGQAMFGLGNFSESQEHLRAVLEADRNHSGAADLLEQAGHLRKIAGLE